MNEKAYRGAEAAYWKVYGPEPSERWLELERPRAKVRVLEIGQGSPLLFLHGGPSAATTFAPLASELRDFRCFVIDRSGCGLSPPIPYADAPLDETFPRLFVACLDALGLDRASIVGSSFGGACALWLARARPERVERIVLAGCPPFVPGATMPLFLRLLATPGIGHVLCRLPSNGSSTQAYLDAMGERNAGAIPEEFVRWWISLGRDTDTMVNERSLVRHGLTFRGMRPELVISEEDLRRMSTPTLLVLGENDPLFAADRAEALFTGMPAGSVERFPGFGHLPWLGDPPRIAERIRSFLRRSPAA